MKNGKEAKFDPLWQWPGKKKKLELEEWYFEDCPGDEINFCWSYEYGRHIHKVIRDFQEDKKRKFKYSGTDIRTDGVWSRTWDWYDEDNRDYDPVDGTEIPLGGFGIDATPGFPDKPFLLTSNRSKLDKEPFNLVSNPVQISPSGSKKIEKTENNYQIHFNWKYSNKYILLAIKDWLKSVDRPKPEKVQGESRKRSQRAELKELGAYRLIKFCGTVTKAMEYVKKNGGKSLPYVYKNKWNAARTKVEERLKKINKQSDFPHPATDM